LSDGLKTRPPAVWAIQPWTLESPVFTGPRDLPGAAPSGARLGRTPSSDQRRRVRRNGMR
jgi:hypothetical protein